MTSDAKIGLLLGLVFIVIIAFLINGLPDFFSSGDNDIKTSITSPEQNSLILGNQADEAVKAINSADSLQSQPREIETSADDYQDIRYAIDFSGSTQQRSTTNQQRPGQALAGLGPQTYVVKPGENLAVIAMSVYGPQRGNKNAVVKEIYMANREVLNSPDELVVGQQLIIPALATTQLNQPKEKSISDSGMFEKVKAFTGRASAIVNKMSDKHIPVGYTVQPGDSLWRIADKVLGDGERYMEIAELNGSLIDDAEDIAVGMHLKLPHR